MALSTSDRGNSALRLRPGAGLQLDDFFTPFNQAALNADDRDLGSGGPLLLPDQPGAHPHLLLFGSKEGRLYLLDRDHLGGFHSGGDDQYSHLPTLQAGSSAPLLTGTEAFTLPRKMTA
jgi:hypothetical protein